MDIFGLESGQISTKGNDMQYLWVLMNSDAIFNIVNVDLYFIFFGNGIMYYDEFFMSFSVAVFFITLTFFHPDREFDERGQIKVMHYGYEFVHNLDFFLLVHICFIETPKWIYITNINVLDLFSFSAIKVTYYILYLVWNFRKNKKFVK